MIKSLLEEYDLEIDDVRWYLSHYLTGKIQSLLFDEKEVIRYIWSGEMEAFLYNMEERFLQDLQEQYDKKKMDESHLRGTFQEMHQLKRLRG